MFIDYLGHTVIHIANTLGCPPFPVIVRSGKKYHRYCLQNKWWCLWSLLLAFGGQPTKNPPVTTPPNTNMEPEFLIQPPWKSYPPWSLTFSPLKMEGWKMNFLLGFGLFSGAMLVLGRVYSETWRIIIFRPGAIIKPSSNIPWKRTNIFLQIDAWFRWFISFKKKGPCQGTFAGGFSGV